MPAKRCPLSFNNPRYLDGMVCLGEQCKADQEGTCTIIQESRKAKAVRTIPLAPAGGNY
jgi:hypothetical protein